MNKFSPGFTIVELLIVIVVIAILAAISVVAYTGVQNRANDVVIANDAATIAKKMELIKVSLGRYPLSNSEFTDDFKITKSAYSTNRNNMMYCLNRITDRYALAMVSKSGKGYLVVSGEVREGVTATHTAACTAVGATWANDANNGVLHGYNVGTGAWAAWRWVS